MPAPHTILVVDDDPGISEALSLVLEDEGFAVATAENGVRALDYLQSHPAPHAILLDLMMPVMDGFTFRSQQLGNPDLATIPTFVMSAGMHASRGAQLHARTFPKPLDLDRLLVALHAA